MLVQPSSVAWRVYEISGGSRQVLKSPSLAGSRRICVTDRSVSKEGQGSFGLAVKADVTRAVPGNKDVSGLVLRCDGGSLARTLAFQQLVDQAVQAHRIAMHYADEDDPDAAGGVMGQALTVSNKSG